MQDRFVILATGLLSVLALTASAPAQRNGASTPSRAPTRSADALIQNWLDMDSDGDGRVSEAEAQGQLKTSFARNDRNEDGFLDRAELARLAGWLTSRNSRLRRPAQVQGLSTDQMLSRVPDGVKATADIAYREGPSKAWRLDLIMPEKPSDTPRPGLVFVHGGGWRSGDKRSGTFLNGAFSYAQKGYVCITVNYRLTGEAPFPACVEDVKCAVRWFRAHAKQYNVDPARIGGYGNSAGAHLVAMLGLVGPEADLEGDGPYQDRSSLLQAVCCSATPSDFLLRPEGLERKASDGQLLSGPVETVEARARQASPVTYVGPNAPPFLVFHGTADNTVNVRHGDRLVEALKQAGAKDVTYIRVEGAGHGVFNSHATETQPAMEAFFDRTLGGK